MQVSEHTQTAHLSKVLNANIALANALANRSEQSNVVRRWLELQQSITLMFDSKTSLSESFVISYVATSFAYIFNIFYIGRALNSYIFCLFPHVFPGEYLAIVFKLEYIVP